MTDGGLTAAHEAAWDVRYRDPQGFAAAVDALPPGPVTTYLRARVADAAGRLDECLRLCDEALGGLDDEPLWRARVHETQGNVLNMVGLVDQAQEQLALAWALYDETGDPVGRASIRQNTAVLSFQDAETELTLLREAYEIALPTGRADLIGLIQLNMASPSACDALPPGERPRLLAAARETLTRSWPEVAVRVSCETVRFALGEGDLDRATELAETLPDPCDVRNLYARVDVALTRAQVLAARGRAPEAVPMLRALLELPVHPDDRLEVGRVLADALRAAGELEEALDVHERTFDAAMEVLKADRCTAGRALDVWHRTTAMREERERARERAADLEAALADLEEAMGRIEEMSIRDAVTGLHNRQFTMRRAPELVAASEHGLAAVALLDIDHFKLVNDQHGHHVGDAVLHAFGRALVARLRPDDLVSRHGGEEFVVVRAVDEGVVCPDGGCAARELADDLEGVRADIASGPWVDEEGHPLPRITFSAGVTSARADLAAALTRADRLMYDAKSAGRAQVRVRPGAPEGEPGGSAVRPGS